MGIVTKTRNYVSRPPASATWECEHRWGPQFNDVSKLTVIRTDGGSLSIRYGRESIDIRAEVVPQLAEMVAAAAAWTDSETNAADGGGMEEA